MVYCSKCGAELPDNAMFCSKCVEKVKRNSTQTEETPAVRPSATESTAPAEAQQPVQNTVTAPAPVPAPAEQTQAKEKKPIDISGMVNRNFLPLYVILGVVSLVLLEFSKLTAFNVFGLGVTFAIVAILCALAFAIVGAIRFFKADTSATGNKHTSGDIICFALGIIAFIFVLVTSIIVLDYAKEFLDAMDTIKKSFEELGEIFSEI